MEEETKRAIGRPKAEYKWKSPYTGENIPATQYYKEVRRLKRETKAQKTSNQYVSSYKSKILAELIEIRTRVEGLIQSEIRLQSN